MREISERARRNSRALLVALERIESIDCQADAHHIELGKMKTNRSAGVGGMASSWG